MRSWATFLLTAAILAAAAYAAVRLCLRLGWIDGLLHAYAVSLLLNTELRFRFWRREVERDQGLRNDEEGPNTSFIATSVACLPIALLLGALLGRARYGYLGAAGGAVIGTIVHLLLWVGLLKLAERCVAGDWMNANVKMKA